MTAHRVERRGKPRRRAPERARAFALAAPPRDAGKRRSSLPILSFALTVAVAVAGYSISARVATERREVARLAAGNAALEAEIATLSDELRVRMRLPQLQRWNDEVLRMQPASARQILGSATELAVYATAPPEALPAPLLVGERAPAEPRAMPPAAPPPARAPELLPAPPMPVVREVPRPGLVLASVEQVIDTALAEAPEEGSLLEPPVPHAAPVLAPVSLPDLSEGPR